MKKAVTAAFELIQRHEKRFIYFILALSFLLCLNGLNWGRVEEWNADQVGMRCCFELSDWRTFNPNFFLKPPFHSYVNFFVSLVPAQGVARILQLNSVATLTLQLLWSRLLTVSFFLMTVFLLHRISKRNFGLRAANLSTLLFATSAGVLSYTHFLTADIPLLFWMVLTFFVAEKVMLTKKLQTFCLTGFLIGLTTATKYNGLLIAVALIVFHLYAEPRPKIKYFILSRKLWLAGLFAALGFVVGNPFSVIDFKSFSEDFYYLFVSESIFINTDKGGSYLGLPASIADLVGYPTLLLFILITFSGVVYSRRKLRLIKPVSWAALSVMVVFILFFGSYSFILKHYLLPLIPFLFVILAASIKVVLPKMTRKLSLVFYTLLLIIISYNLVAVWYMGRSFLSEPRMQAQIWAVENIEPGSVIERSTYTPNFNLLFQEDQFITLDMPLITGRITTLDEMEPQNDVIARKSRQHEGSENENWYLLDEFGHRNADYVAVNSSHYFFGYYDATYRQHHPIVHNFFDKLLNEELGYKIVFDQTTKPAPWYLYPQEIDFLKNHLTILKKESNSLGSSHARVRFSEQEITALLKKSFCAKQSLSFKECYIEVSRLFKSYAKTTSSSDAVLQIIDTLDNPKADVTELDNFPLLLEPRSEIMKYNERVFLSILLYYSALNSSESNQPQAVEILLSLATQLSPEWSYFSNELANYYFHNQQPELARNVVQECFAFPTARGDCFEYYKDTRLNGLSPIGFTQESISKILTD